MPFYVCYQGHDGSPHVFSVENPNDIGSIDADLADLLEVPISKVVEKNLWRGVNTFSPEQAARYYTRGLGQPPIRKDAQNSVEDSPDGFDWAPALL